METIAVYWEPVVRVYGYDIKRDLSLFEITTPCDFLAEIGDAVEQLYAPDRKFTMVQVHQEPDQRFRVCIAVADDDAETLQATLADSLSAHDDILIKAPFGVELLSFHGPHFQDRYGIAEATFSALADSDITIFAAGCTGTSVYLITDVGKAATAQEILSASFVVPAPRARKDLLRQANP